MEINSCGIHIDQALEDFIAEEQRFPVMTEVEEEDKLCTKCTYCENSAVYMVANK